MQICVGRIRVWRAKNPRGTTYRVSEVKKYLISLRGAQLSVTGVTIYD